MLQKIKFSSVRLAVLWHIWLWIVQRYCDILQYKHWCSIKYVQKILELCLVKYNVISWCSEFQKNAVNITGVAIAAYLVSSEQWNCKNSVSILFILPGRLWISTLWMALYGCHHLFFSFRTVFSEAIIIKSCLNMI